MTIDEGFGSLRDAVRDAFGGIQVSATGGGGQDTTWSVALGERRVMSGFALIAVLIGGVLLGAAVFGRGR